jgi:hypothetical protein
MVRMRVALVAGGFPKLSAPYDNQGPELPYSERATVDLAVQEDDSLLSTFERALAELGVSFADPETVAGSPVDQVSLLAFYKPEDEAGSPLLDRCIYPHTLSVVPEDGRIRWGVTLRDARVADLRRAGEYGLVDGDPLRPYVVILPAAGASELGLTWAALLTALSVAANLDGTLNLIDRVRRRVARGRKVIDDHYLDWGQRGGGPAALAQTLRRTPWSSDDLALLLGVNPEEVAALMELYGFALEDDGRWAPTDDQEARLLRLLEEDAISAFNASTRQGLIPEVDFRDRAQSRFTSLERPSRGDSEE